VALLAVAMLFSVVRHLTTPQNIARGRPVQASSRHPGTPDASGLTDGIKGTYGVHTLVGQPGTPWVTVDLGQPRDLRQIVVYNRGDSHFDDGLPYVVLLSTDGKTFTELARRATHFGSGGTLSPPWIIDCDKRGQYVRIEAQHYVVLSELEVFAK